MARQIVVDIIGDAKKYTKATDQAVKSSKGLGGAFEKLDAKMSGIGKKGGIAGAMLGGLGVGAGLGVFSLIENGVGSVVGALQEGIKAAIEDEKATARLTQTIQANVRAWDGNLVAVNAAIKAGAQLAFTDDEVRAGLNQLIPRTKDLTEAIKLNRLAMDLARAKGLGLEEAATLVGKAYSGQASALKRAGISIKNTKNSTAALAELQAVVQDQAVTYAQTTEGSMEALDIQIAELNETVGYLLLPTFKELVNFANTQLTPAIDSVASQSGLLNDAFHLLTEAAFAPLLPLKVTVEELNKHKDDIVGVVDDMTGQVHESVQQFNVPAAGTVQFFDPIVTASQDSLREVLRPWKRAPKQVGASLEPLAGIVKGSVQKAKEQAKKDMADLKWALTHPMSDKQLRNVWRGELKGAYSALHQAQKTGNAVAIAKAQALITGLKAKIRELDSLTFSLTGEFHIGKKDAAQLRTYFSGLGAGNTGHTRLTSEGQTMYHRAQGGPVSAGGTYLVGERGPEVLTMGGNGHVTPNHRLGGGNSYNITVNVAPGGDLVEAGRQMVRAITSYERRSGKVWRSAA